MKNIKFPKTVKNGLKHCKWQNKLTKSKNSYYKNVICDIWNKLSIFNFFLLFFNFHFLKTVILGYFWFFSKNTPKLKELFKKRSKSSICPIIFHISWKKIHFLTLTFFLGPLTWNRPSVELGTVHLGKEVTKKNCKIYCDIIFFRNKLLDSIIYFLKQIFVRRRKKCGKQFMNKLLWQNIFFCPQIIWWQKFLHSGDTEYPNQCG